MDQVEGGRNGGGGNREQRLRKGHESKAAGTEARSEDEGNGEQETRKWELGDGG